MPDRTSSLRLLWLCGVPKSLEQKASGAGRDLGATSDWSWIVAHFPPPDGVELHVACPSKYITESIEIEHRHAHFHVFPCMRGAAYSLYRSWLPGFRRLYEEIRPDWVHGWGTEAGFGSAALSLTSDRSIVEIQGILSDYYPHLPKSLPLWFSVLNERITLGKATRLLAESEYSAREIKKYASGKVGVISQPLRDDFLQTGPGQINKNQIVFLGELADRKGVKDAVRAFASGAPNDWNLSCVGCGAAKYEQEIKQLAQELKVENRVRMCGVLSSGEIVSLFQESPVFLLPSYMDTGPTALKEALAMGLWPVCYDNSGPRELIGSYHWGSLSETGNIPSLAENLRKTLTDRPWEQSARRRGCVEGIRHDLSRQTIWKQLLDCYTEEYWTRFTSVPHGR